MKNEYEGIDLSPKLFLNYEKNPNYSLEKRIYELSDYAESSEPQQLAEYISLLIEYSVCDSINNMNSIATIGMALKMKLSSLLALANNPEEMENIIIRNWYNKDFN